MTLTASDVAEIVRLLEQSSFDELNLEINGVKLSLKRGSGVGGAAPASGVSADYARSNGPGGPAVGGATAASGPAHAGAPGAGATAGANLDPNVAEVPSPLLGTFYRAPKPGAPPFVEVGVVVDEDTVVAIIEVMKLMNTVRAGVRGTVTEILVSDGSLVEYGDPLLRVRKAD